MSQPAMTFSWWRRGGGGAVHAVPATSEREVGHCATDMAAAVSRSGAAQQGMATAAWQTGHRGEMAAAAMQSGVSDAAKHVTGEQVGRYFFERDGGDV
jgi:hypothetical protein